MIEHYKTGKLLQKGDSLLLKNIDNIEIGVNWSPNKSKTFFGLITKSLEAVDLDTSVAVFNSNKNLIDWIYFNNLISSDTSIEYLTESRDFDFTDDSIDNELFKINLNKISSDAHTIIFFLNSHGSYDFSMISGVRIRISDQHLDYISNKTLATFSLQTGIKYNGHCSLLLASLVRDKSDWKFNIISEPFKSSHLKDSIKEISENWI